MKPVDEEWLKSEVVQEEETKPEVDAKKEAKKPDLKSVLQEKAASLMKAWDAGMKSVPQLLERFNMKDMQEEMVRSFKHLREASESESTEELEEATNHVKEMLSQLKELSEGIESSLSQKVLEMTANEKPTVTLKKKKSKRSRKHQESSDAKDPKDVKDVKDAKDAKDPKEPRLVSRSSVDSTSEEELVESTKPTFYPYSFQERPSQFDVDDFVKGSLMDKIQEDSFKGFYNFTMIYMIASVVMLIIYNFAQRGWLITFDVLTCARSWEGVFVAMLLCGAILLHSLQYYALWKLHVKLHLSYPVTFSIYAVLQVVFAVMYSVLIWRSIIPPLTAVLPMMLMVVMALKGHSFIFTNYGMEKQSTESIPNSFGHYCYFLVCPTLLYELDYPRTKTIRFAYVARTGLYMCVAFSLMYAIMMQFVYPILSDTSSNLIYRILRCSLSAFIIWLLLFFSVFHCLLNILAEVTMFGDRLLYEDWWNATTLAEFWKKWNGPIHYWCLRHVYVETQVYAKASKPLASLATFFVSGVAHELVCSVVFRKPSLYFFLGMVVQVPLQLICKHFENSRIGNMIVWVSLFLGQPLLELSYCQDWFARYPSLFC